MKTYKLRGFQRFENKNSFIDLNEIVNIKEKKKKLLRAITAKNGELHVDGDAVKNIWFPINNKYKVFISHSHNDNNIAGSLAKEIEDKFGVSCFVDGAVWLFYKDLADCFANRYKCYDVDKIRENVYMLLVQSLFEVLINSEYFFFIETSNSIDYSNDNVTYSPWLFFELTVARYLRNCNIPLIEARQASKSSSLIFDYKTFLNSFTSINYRDYRSEIENYEPNELAWLFDEFEEFMTNFDKKKSSRLNLF